MSFTRKYCILPYILILYWWPHLQRYQQENVWPWQKTKKVVENDWYITLVSVKISGMWSQYDCSDIQTVYETHKNDLNWKFWSANCNMWKSGVYELHNKKYKVIYWPFCCVAMHLTGLSPSSPSWQALCH